MSYLDVNLCHLFKKEANLSSVDPASLFVVPFPRPLTFTLSLKKERLQDGRLEGGRLAVSANIFSNEISLQCTTSFMVLSFDITASRFFFLRRSTPWEKVT